MDINALKNKLSRKILFSAVIIIIIISTSYFVLIRYEQFNFYKSDRFAELAMPFSQSINMYFYHFLKHPTSGDELIEFLIEKRLIDEVFGAKIPLEIISQGIGIKKINDDSLICVYLLGQNEKDDSTIALKFPEEISFTDFLFNKADMLICCRTPTSICEIRQVKLYFQTRLVINDTIEKNINKTVKRFIIRNTQEINNIKEWVNPKEYYFYGKVKEEGLEINVVCNPDNSELRFISDSLELLLWNDVNMNGIDEFYFPMLKYDLVYQN